MIKLMPYISVVIPVYKAEECISELYSRLKSSLELITNNFEIILVEDCGGDRSWELIKILAEQDLRVKGLQFSRNFGQHYGITAGLDVCDAEWIVVMDCDLQDQPEEIPLLLAKALEGFDVVFARRNQRKDSYLKKLSSHLFHLIFQYLTDVKSDESIANFGIYHSKVILNYRRMRESVRSFPLFVNWLGFNKAAIDVKHAERPYGSSSYTFIKLLKLAVNSIVAQSNKPLRLSIKAGFLMAAGSVALALYYAIRYFLYEIPVQGWTSVIVSMYFLAGLFFINTGFIGLYIGRIYDETKRRPLYVVNESVNLSLPKEGSRNVET
jgi:dolichol-phosphate mannosyltransferase